MKLSDIDTNCSVALAKTAQTATENVAQGV